MTREVVFPLEPLVLDEHDYPFVASAIATPDPDGQFEVCLEFIDPQSHEARRTGVETRQPARPEVMLWAAALSTVDLRQALRRAVATAAADREPIPGDELERLARRDVPLLHRRLDALSRPQLLALIAAHQLNPAGLDLAQLDRLQLLTFASAAMQLQAARKRRPAA